MATEYQKALGERLRSIRNQQGMTLQDVEERSGGDWKAVVVGSYERGDRAISVPKLARLAAFYGVPVSEFLPESGDPRSSTTTDTLRIVIDLTALDPDADGPVGAIARYARAIQLHRGDYNGRVLTIRADDLEAVAAACGLPGDAMLDVLAEQRILLRG